MAKSSYLKIFVLFLTIISAGCNNLSTVSLLESEPMETKGDVPASARYIPMTKLDMILDETMGSDREILFATDEQKETFVVFEPNVNKPVKMAQVRRIANSKGSAVIFVGLNTEHNPESIVKVYSYEFNKNIHGYNLYAVGKDKFLQQFDNRLVNNDIDKIDGITGATPIWRPISEQINEIVTDLIELKHDSEFLNFIQAQGKQWKRQSSTEVIPGIVLDIEETSTESDGDLLFAHWKLIGMAEMSLMIAGMFIIVFARLKRRKE